MCLNSWTWVEISVCKIWYVVRQDLKKKSGCDLWDLSSTSFLGLQHSFGAKGLSEVCILTHSLLFWLEDSPFHKAYWVFFFFFCLVLERDVCCLVYFPQNKLITHIVVQAFNWELHHLKLRATTYPHWAFSVIQVMFCPFWFSYACSS